ncbi:MAG: Asp-tRNA(Asn)/Glu-tRNA(Gln) amidotransferase subunit GatA [Candidatus Kerfeldbacteria bacterium]|nr:Asp-tRNA(Asn)/Glu-tRNA(Gln) amidotransferase subunit GatA [Candidatus Kerfeldbacteria bacterium]
MSIGSIRQRLVDCQLSTVELVDAYLSHISSQDRALGSFLHVDADGARAAARALDQRIQSGDDLPRLAGTVVAVKDNITVKGLPATAGSRILAGYDPPYDATVVARLRAAGVIIIGKTNLDEFAMGASTEQSAWHPTKNPRDPERVPGGSSGGSAAAVAAGMCTVALGSDTGGSIRQPAAFCGLVGVRPTYGSVSRYGLIAMASSMDVIGPLARSVADARQVLAAIAGYDPDDATTLPHVNLSARAGQTSLTGRRVGVPKEYVAGITDQEVRDSLSATVDRLGAAGAEVIEVSLPTTALAVPTYYVITPAEASSNLARYDGLRFGQPSDRTHGHGAASARLRGQLFGREPKRRITIGTFTLSAGYADRYYHAAQRVRTLIRQDFARVFDQVDLLLTPVAPTPAFPLGSVADPLAMYQQDIFLAAVSLAGLPAAAIPVPTSGQLPVGAQLIGRSGDDNLLLDVAEGLEQALPVSP